MEIHALQSKDILAAEALCTASGYNVDLRSSLIETAHIVSDDRRQMLAVCVATRAPEIVLAFEKSASPEVRLRALSCMHRAIHARGYPDAHCSIAGAEKESRPFSQRIFDWVPGWKFYTLTQQARAAEISVLSCMAMQKMRAPSWRLQFLKEEG